jgi:methylated-DNA-protein-cysteine methyltransferase related protein
MSSGSKPKSHLTLAIADTIRRVPGGRVSTYGAIAKAAGYPRSARQVGRVLREMPGLPWQRILGSGGRICVPREFALEQRFLLESEGVKFRGRRVDLAAFEHRFASKKAAKAAPKKRVKAPGTLLRRKL